MNNKEKISAQLSKCKTELEKYRGLYGDGINDDQEKKEIDRLMALIPHLEQKISANQGKKSVDGLQGTCLRVQEDGEFDEDSQTLQYTVVLNRGTAHGIERLNGVSFKGLNTMGFILKVFPGQSRARVWSDSAKQLSGKTVQFRTKKYIRKDVKVKPDDFDYEKPCHDDRRSSNRKRR